MAGISSSAITNAATNAYKANGGTELGSGEWADGKGLELYETTYRSFDAQIGRFMQVDPLIESTARLAGYVFSANNPVAFNDPNGDEYSHKDRQGNLWHHADVLAGTAAEGQPYESGNGVDGFGDDNYGGGGGGGSGTGGDGFYLEGDAAVQFFSGLQKNMNNADDNGDWSFTVRTNKDGQLGYWEAYSFSNTGQQSAEILGHDGIQYAEVGVGSRFVTLPGKSW